MRHPTDGVLRRLLDEPSGTADADRDHVAGCEVCLDALDELRGDAQRVEAALGTRPGQVDPPSAVDVDAAWQRLLAADRHGRPAGAVVALGSRDRRRGGLRRPAVAGVAVAVVLAGASTAAANGWLPIFEAERVAPVRLTLDDLNAVPDLDDFGELDLTGDPDLRTVAGAGAAEAATGLDVPRVTALPRGIAGDPRYRVADEVSAVFTFDADELGADRPAVPPGLDGSQVRLTAGPGVVQTWSSGGGVPGLVVGRAVAPTAFSSSGASFEELRDYLLSVPGLPEDVAASLRTFNADGTTLPVPVPADRFATSEADVGGVEATVLEAHDRTMAAVIWVVDGEVLVVAGSLDAGEVLAVAKGLR